MAARGGRADRQAGMAGRLQGPRCGPSCDVGRDDVAGRRAHHQARSENQTRQPAGVRDHPRQDRRPRLRTDHTARSEGYTPAQIATAATVLKLDAADGGQDQRTKAARNSEIAGEAIPN